MTGKGAVLKNLVRFATSLWVVTTLCACSERTELILPGKPNSVELQAGNASVYLVDATAVEHLEGALREARPLERRSYTYVYEVLIVNYEGDARSAVYVYPDDDAIVYHVDGWDYEAPAADEIIRELLQRVHEVEATDAGLGGGDPDVLP